jgi:hypothetical protein
MQKPTSRTRLQMELKWKIIVSARLKRADKAALEQE